MFIILNISAEKLNENDLVHSASTKELEVLPKLLKESQALYPDSLIKEGIEGTVLLDLLIDTVGVVESVSVISGLHPVLDSLALSLAYGLMFSPAKIGNEKVAVSLQYEYLYSMGDVIQELEDYINLSGVVFGKGTRKKISDALVVVTYSDSTIDNDSSLNLLEKNCH